MNEKQCKSLKNPMTFIGSRNALVFSHRIKVIKALEKNIENLLTFSVSLSSPKVLRSHDVFRTFKRIK
jgi:hypothetical protein